MIKLLRCFDPEDRKREIEFVIEQMPGQTWTNVASFEIADETDVRYSRDPERTATALVVRLK